MVTWRVPYPLVDVPPPSGPAPLLLGGPPGGEEEGSGVLGASFWSGVDLTPLVARLAPVLGLIWSLALSMTSPPLVVTRARRLALPATLRSALRARPVVS